MSCQEGFDLPLEQEYFCNTCGQLRGSFVKNKFCFNCKSYDIIIGQPGELNREKLKSNFKKGEVNED